MAAQTQESVKRNLYKNKVSSASSKSDFDSDDSVRDQNYYPDVTWSDSLTDCDLSVSK